MSSAGLTRTGQFVGTVDYSAPEQIQGRTVDGRADQYALACVAYQLLTGAAPFSRDQEMAVLLAHMSEPPPLLSSRRPDLPGPADQVLARGMAKVPEKRYGSCQEFADALRNALGLPPYDAHSSDAVPRHPPTEIITRSGPSDPATVGTETAAGLAERPKAVRTFRGSCAVNSVAFSPDRRLVAISANEKSVLVWDAIAAQPHLRLPVRGWAVLFSADGKWLITADPRTARIWDTETGTQLLSITHRSSRDHAVALTPDSRWLATSSPGHKVRIWSTADGRALMTISLDLLPNSSWNADAAVGLAFSPDGRWLATASTDTTARIWNLGTGQMLAEIPHQKAVRTVAFSPDGDHLATASKQSAQIWALHEGSDRGES